MNVLLSVKPKYAEKIVEGKKKYEFRRAIFKKQNIEKVYIYSTSPVSKIIATFEIEKILKDSPEKIWKLCQKYAGISKKDFFDYFKNSEMAFAIEIGYVNSFQEPIDPYLIIEDFTPPQSFYYLPHDFLQNQWDVVDTELVMPSLSTESVSGISFIGHL
ncbi:MAG: ASCH domain-containing protein [Candidatus Methanoperedens sp.]|nr:ASCH domain-containing protein [Candidatus Methanoperedens sp.]